MRFEIGGNPTTGYQWYVNLPSANSAFDVVKSYRAADNPEGYMGVGGTYFFDVTAGDNAGSGHFEIDYYRPWESVNSSMNSYKIPINVLA
mmetsp:Transcript_16128/g.21852  ORF Transcript_16128/g.21852 Transcript_16128/m.21852 type:complete len:90 (-) Transcript_16128:102-371(-)